MRHVTTTLAQSRIDFALSPFAGEIAGEAAQERDHQYRCASPRWVVELQGNATRAPCLIAPEGTEEPISINESVLTGNLLGCSL